MTDNEEKVKNPKKLGEILVHYKIITPQQLKKALDIQKNTGKRIGEILIDKGWVTQDEINWTLGRQLDIPYVHINIENNIHEIFLKMNLQIPHDLH